MGIMLSDRVEASPEVLVQEVSGEMVLLDLKSEAYFGLDSTGTRIWQLINETDSLQSVYEAMLAEYEVDEDQLRQDFIALMNQLTDAGLISVKP